MAFGDRGQPVIDRGLAALAARLAAGETEIRALDRSLYGSGAAQREGADLWKVIGQGLQPKRGEPRCEDDGPGALYL